MNKVKFLVKDESINTTIPNNEAYRLLGEPEYQKILETLRKNLLNNEIKNEVYRLAQFYLNNETIVNLCKAGYRFDYLKLNQTLSNLSTQNQVSSLYNTLKSEYEMVTGNKQLSTGRRNVNAKVINKITELENF